MFVQYVKMRKAKRYCLKTELIENYDLNTETLMSCT